jgi:hypothetical protein
VGRLRSAQDTPPSDFRPRQTPWRASQGPGAAVWVLIAGFGLLALAYGAHYSQFPDAMAATVPPWPDVHAWLKPNLGWIVWAFPLLLLGTLFPLLVWFGFLAVWFPLWILSSFNWLGAVVGSWLSRRRRARPKLRPLPPGLRYWGALVVFLIGVAALLLALLQVHPESTQQAVASILFPQETVTSTGDHVALLERILDALATAVRATWNAVVGVLASAARFIDTLILTGDVADHKIDVLEKIFAGLVTIVSVSAAAEAVDEFLAGEELNNEQKRVLGRLARRVRIHRDLVRRHPKLVVMGSKPKDQAQENRECLLLEIWLGMPGYKFDAIELLNVVDSRMASDIDECDVVVVVGKNREVVGHDTLKSFRGLLVGGTEDSCDPETEEGSGKGRQANSLGRALAECDKEALRKLLDPGVIGADATNYFTAELMVKATATKGHKSAGAHAPHETHRPQRILVLDQDHRYLGFCNLKDLVHEVFGK